MEDKTMATLTAPVPVPTHQLQAIDMRPLIRAAAAAELRQGLKMFAIGAVVTVGTFMLADAIGAPIFLVSFGPLIYGAYHSIHGLYKLATA
jgi:hypothetical protein